MSMRSRHLLVAGLYLAVSAVLQPSALAGQAGAPAGAVPAAVLQARRAALLARMGTGIAVLQGMSERSADPPDSDYPQDASFRQDNDVFYLTGLEEPDLWLVLIARDSTPGEVRLYLPRRNPAQEQWLGVRLGPGREAAAVAGLDSASVRPADSAEAEILALVSAADSPARRGALYLKGSRRSSESPFFQKLLGSGARFENLLPPLGALRVVKDDDEIARLRRAATISAEGHLAAMRVAVPGAWEYELEAAAEGTFRRLGAERVGYPSIVGTGINSTVLHYDESRDQLSDGDLIVMDMAAEFGYYTADVTRTIPASGKFTARQRAIYDLVLGTQQAAIDSVRPGITLGQLGAIARRYMKEHSGDLCAPATCDAYFIHGLSHWIGMDVHDVGPYNIPLVPGMVFTVEPGIYIPAEKLGVRIEDDVLVTATGYELLSRNAPRRAAEVESVMAKGRPAGPKSR
jgi:Xaa-Pro aminopeptidase